MRNLAKIIHAKVYVFSELTLAEQHLLSAAAKARLNAQAPYSKYLVGAAILSNRGTVHCGCNVERCTYTQTTHAEQNAIDNMVAELGSAKIEAIALVAGPADADFSNVPAMINYARDKTISDLREVPIPCGHCLQIIWENCWGDPNVRIIALAPNGEVVVTTIGDAFPMRFGPDDLGINYGVTDKQSN